MPQRGNLNGILSHDRVSEPRGRMTSLGLRNPDEAHQEPVPGTSVRCASVTFHVLSSFSLSSFAHDTLTCFLVDETRVK